VEPLYQVVQSVADSLLMNEIEICVWSIYLDKLEPNWIQTADKANQQLVSHMHASIISSFFSFDLAMLSNAICYAYTYGMVCCMLINSNPCF
jgi:hypothetical protein